MLLDEDLELMFWDSASEDEFGLARTRLHQVPFAADREASWGRWLRRARTCLGQNFFASVGSEASWLRDRIAQLRPDVVLIHFEHWGLRLIDVLWDLGIPVVVHMHGYASGSGHRHRWFRHAWAKRVDRFARFIAVGRHEVAFMRSLGVEAERIALIPCGVPEELLGIAAPGTSPSLFLTVGRLVPKKAPQLIVEAFADAVPELPGAKLVMVGDGPLRPDVESIIRSRALQDRVTLTGAQPPSVVKQYLASASVFVQHSVTPPDGDIEGWPVATAEAMAAGLPVIGTDHPGVRDQIDSERTGLLVPERDVQGLRDAMLRLGRDPVLRERIGAEATRYMREFVVPRQVEKLRRVLHDVSRHGARHRGAGAPQAAVAAR